MKVKARNYLFLLHLYLLRWFKHLEECVYLCAVFILFKPSRDLLSAHFSHLITLSFILKFITSLKFVGLLDFPPQNTNFSTFPSTCSHSILACCLWSVHQVRSEQHYPAHSGLPKEVCHPRLPGFHLTHWWSVWEFQISLWRTGVSAAPSLSLFSPDSSSISRFNCCWLKFLLISRDADEQHKKTTKWSPIIFILSFCCSSSSIIDQKSTKDSSHWPISNKRACELVHGSFERMGRQPFSSDRQDPAGPSRSFVSLLVLYLDGVHFKHASAV